MRPVGKGWEVRGEAGVACWAGEGREQREGRGDWGKGGRKFDWVRSSGGEGGGLSLVLVTNSVPACRAPECGVRSAEGD